MDLTQEDIKNILALIALAPIKGNEALAVALLQQKLSKGLTPEIKTTSETTGTTKEEEK